ncbi:MAG: zinc ribbon domain-containing protein [Candidatus Hydrogenedentes bacterium]|nr:zinc ribbon domain-containing protein [Candidatus Hydrogenedentota bacterium]
MPTYSYECKRCSHVQDIFHAMSASPKIKCEKCGGACIRLLGAGAGIIFKGTGFYETDYKNKGKAPSGNAGKNSSTTGEQSAKSEKKEVSTAAKAD